MLSSLKRVLIGLVAGVSLAIVAGYILSRRHRRYRAIPTAQEEEGKAKAKAAAGAGAGAGKRNLQHSQLLKRVNTFSHHSTDNRESESVGDGTPFPSINSEQNGRGYFGQKAFPLSPALESSPPHREDKNRGSLGGRVLNPQYQLLPPIEYVDGPEPIAERHSSVSSDDSFHSATEDVGERNAFYDLGVEEASRGLVACRKMRTEILQCSSDTDFLGKLYCVRCAFDQLLLSQANRLYFRQAGQRVVSSFLYRANQDPSLFTERYEDLIQFLEVPENWAVTEKELTSRKVVALNVYDVALDFVLLDAFTDLDSPPSSIVSALQNRWFTEGMKRSGLSAAVWSLLRAKRSMLQHPNGFMAKFYLLSETLTPTLAWGFLGTNEELRKQCKDFKERILGFTRSVFSLEAVRYSSVYSLADDILHLAQQLVEGMA